MLLPDVEWRLVSASRFSNSVTRLAKILKKMIEIGNGMHCSISFTCLSFVDELSSYFYPSNFRVMPLQSIVNHFLFPECLELHNFVSVDFALRE